MHKKTLSLQLVILILTIVFAFPGKVGAASFSSASLMLYRTATSQSNVQMLVVVQPSSATSSRTETELTIQFGSGFSVQSTASNIQTSVSGLPSSYQGHSLVAMPGVGSSANSVSGQTAHFSITNLSAGTYYAFYITQGITTPSSAGNYVHTISTIDGSGTIDTQNVGTKIVSNDQVTVSAAVQPLSTDGSIALSGSPTTTTTLERGDEIIVTATYQHSLSSSQRMEIVAGWDKGYLTNAPTSQVTAVSYKVGSATNTDTNVAPVVDLTNRTVTWTIPSVNPNVTHTVSFTLTVSSSLSSITPLVVQEIHLNGTLIDTTLSSSTLTYNGNFYVEETAAPTPTSAPGPSATPGPATTTAPTPTAVPNRPFSIDSVALRAVTKEGSKIILTTSEPSTYTLFYGLKPNQLTRLLTGLSSEVQHLISLENLSGSTQYYFRVVAENASGKEFLSDIFTFTTATTDQIVQISYGTVIWNQLPLGHMLDMGVGGSSGSFIEPGAIFVPGLKPLVFTFAFDNPEKITSVTLRIQDSKVLGITTYSPSIHLNETQLLESLPGYFTGQVIVPAQPGTYKVLLEVADISQGLHTQELPYELYVGKPLQVRNKATGLPIENAKVMIFKYENYKKLYIPLDSLISYDHQTDERGMLDIVLPEGSYRYEVSAVGYKDVIVSQVLDTQFVAYPQFELEADAMFVGGLAKQWDAMKAVGKYLQMHGNELVTSADVRRLVRDAGVILGLILFISVEYFRKYCNELAKIVRKNTVSWIFFQCGNFVLMMWYGSFLLITVLMASRLAFSLLYVHGIVLLADTLLWSLSVYYAHKILIYDGK